MLDFLILYEHKVRELENICLIRAELENRGYSVDFFNIREPKKIKYFLNKKPKVIVTSCLYDNVELNYYIYATVGKVKKVVNLQWEQVLSSKWEKVNFHTPRNNAINATHICWGAASKKRLENAGVNNAIVTGPIHMDLLRNEFKNYYRSLDELVFEYNLNPKNRTFLYISSFTLASMTEEEVSDLEKRVSSNIKDFQDAMILSKQETLKWIEKLLSQEKNINFVYRPHPNERNDFLIEQMKQNYPNFRVISDYSVKQWILVADKIFTWISTSIVEAYFANKFCGILRPVLLDKDLDMVIYKDAKIINSYEKMLEVIVNKPQYFPINEKIISNHYLVDDNEPSYLKICNVLEDVLISNKYDMEPFVDFRARIKHFIRAVIHQNIPQLNQLIKYKLLPSKKIISYIENLNDTRKMHENDFAQQGEINEILSKMKIILKGL